MIDYELLIHQARALVDAESDPIANAANLSALIASSVSGLNWAGFYFLRGGELVLGPFQGKPACVRIALGSGVCGTAAERRETIVVDDVHAFPGHIACDNASKSEMVVPLISHGELVGVLDIDSPVIARFGAPERLFFEAIALLYLEQSEPTAMSA